MIEINFFPIFAVGGWSMLIAGLAEKVLKKTGVLEDEKEDNEKPLW